MKIEADLNAKRAELDRIQDDLRKERARLTRLRARLAESRAALSARLVHLYKADEPDVVTVVLESEGFEDLLQRTEFMQRVSRQDARILDRVRKAKTEATATEAKLDRYEGRQRKVTKIVSQRRLEVLAIKNRLVDRRQQAESVRTDKRQALVSTRADRQQLQGHLVALQKEEAKVRARLAGFSGTAGPIRQGSGAMIWPTNGAFTSPFGQRWGRLHAGIDIGAPEGTPIRAAMSGKVVVAGWTGGYGNYTCIQHGGALSTCYGHQSRYATSVGANVSKGDLIGYVGNTGNSTGAHLHFETRVNGNPVNPMGYLYLSVHAQARARGRRPSRGRAGLEALLQAGRALRGRRQRGHGRGRAASCYPATTTRCCWTCTCRTSPGSRSCGRSASEPGACH